MRRAIGYLGDKFLGAVIFVLSGLDYWLMRRELWKMRRSLTKMRETIRKFEFGMELFRTRLVIHESQHGPSEELRAKMKVLEGMHDRMKLWQMGAEVRYEMYAALAVVG